MKSGLLYRVLAIVGIVVNAVCFAVNLLSALVGFIYSVGFYHWFAMQVLFPTAVVLLVWMLVSGSSRLKSAFFGYVAVYVLSTAIALFFEGTGLFDFLYLIVSLLLGGVCCVLPIMRFHDLCALLASRSTKQPANGAAAGREQAAPAGQSGAKFSMPKPGKKSKEQKSKRRTGLDFEPGEAADATAAANAQATAGAQGATERASSQQAASSQPAAAQAASSQGTYQQTGRQQTASSAGWSGTPQQTASQQAAVAQSTVAQSTATEGPAARPASAQAGASSQGSTGGAIAVNTCPRDAFLTLPGFSIAQASQAVSEREQNGPYRSVDDFVARNNIKPHFAIQMEGLISVEVATKASAAASKRPRGRGLDL